MPTNSPSSSVSARIITIDGMPGAGKTTAANYLATAGHLVIGEYTSDQAALLDVEEHPDVNDDAAHQANWLRKHRQATRAEHACRPVFLDRDWLTSLAYAQSIGDDELLADRARWAVDHLRMGALTPASTYFVLHVDPAESLRRRRGRLVPGHPWSTEQALRRLACFYRDPARHLAPVDDELATVLGRAGWVHLDSPTRDLVIRTLVRAA